MSNKIKQHQEEGLEEYVTLTADISIQGNVQNVFKCLEGYDWKEAKNLREVIRIVLKRYHKLGANNYPLKDLAIIKTKADIKFRSAKHKKKWKGLPTFKEYSKYVPAIEKGDKFPPIVIAHPAVLGRTAGVSEELLWEDFYNLDGMHRIMSYLETGIKQTETYVVVPRDLLSNYLPEGTTDRLLEYCNATTWFGHYQVIREVGLNRGRGQVPRYSSIYDFRKLAGSTVVDFGCNLGQACVEANFCGAREVYGFDYLHSCLGAAQEASDVLGIGNIYTQIDFNLPGWEDKALNVVDGWDCLLFLAVYRTKEIKNIESVFDFLVANTRKYIFFEGHADPRIDTPQYYDKVFRKYNFSKITALGKSDNRPAYFIEK